MWGHEPFEVPPRGVKLPTVITSHEFGGLDAGRRGRFPAGSWGFFRLAGGGLMSNGGPISIAILDDVDLVTRGLEEMCGDATRELSIRTITSDGTSPEPVDIVLYDG